MRVPITYGGFNLQDGTINITQEFEHDSVDYKDLDLQGLDGRDGGKLVDVTFTPRRIRIRGQIKGTSQANLETNIDNFKKNLNKSGQDLDIGYAGGTRRYICDMAKIIAIRRHYNLTFIDFEVEFVINLSPFGRAIDTTTMEYTQSSITTWAGSFVASGTRRPLPRIEVTFTEAHDITRLRFRNITTGDMIIVDNDDGFNANDVVIIDTSDYTVTLNGSAWDYQGFFPSFVVDGNDFRVSAETGIRFKMTVKIIYYPLYL